MVLRKVIFWLVLAALLVGGGLFAQDRFGPRDLATLERDYRLPASQFADIDGIRVHFVDEGPKDQPCLVLLHGDFMSLRAWDELAQELAPHARVVRMDLLTAGLTGPDPRDAYSVEREMQIVEGLTQQLGVAKFVLVGTSTGGIVAYRYAAAHPDRVSRLILMDASGLPGVADRAPHSTGWLGDWLIRHVRFETYWIDWLYDQFGTFPPSRELADMVYDMNRRRGLRAEFARHDANFQAGDTQHILSDVAAPTLLLWGTADPTTPQTDAEVFALWLTNAPSLIKKYPHIGHYPYIETPDVVGSDILAFIAGKWDAHMARTTRVPAPQATAASP